MKINAPLNLEDMRRSRSEVVHSMESGVRMITSGLLECDPWLSPSFNVSLPAWLSALLPLQIRCMFWNIEIVRCRYCWTSASTECKCLRIGLIGNPTLIKLYLPSGDATVACLIALLEVVNCWFQCVNLAEACDRHGARKVFFSNVVRLDSVFTALGVSTTLKDGDDRWT